MTKTAQLPARDDLYTTDLCLWTEEQAALLRAGRWPDLDRANVAEEIESLGGSQKAEIRSRLAILLLHLLKWEFQPEKRKYGWRASILEQRIRIDDLIDVSPSLQSWPGAVLAKAYSVAVLGAASETGLPGSVFPKSCPYAIEQIRDLGFYPGTPETDVV